MDRHGQVAYIPIWFCNILIWHPETLKSSDSWSMEVPGSTRFSPEGNNRILTGNLRSLNWFLRVLQNDLSLLHISQRQQSCKNATQIAASTVMM